MENRLGPVLTVYLVNKKKTSPIKLFLISLILIVFILMMTVFIGYRRVLNQNKQHVSVSSGQAGISINKFNQIASRNGIKEWRLDAGSAKYIDPKKRAVLQDISVTFFLKNNRKTHLSADHGVLQTQSNDIEVNGNVIVSNQNYRLKTKSLLYQHGKRVIYSRDPVQMTGDSFQFSAKSMSFDLNSNQTTLVGNVEGTISEDFAL